MIKDSGDRTEFETGAKRDMHAGKGRMDLLPWYGIMEVSKHCEEGALKYGEHNVDKGIPLHSLLDVLLATLQSTWSGWTTKTTYEPPAGTCCGLLTSGKRTRSWMIGLRSSRRRQRKNVPGYLSSAPIA